MLLSSYAINRNVTANSTLLLIEHVSINRTYTIEMLLLIEHVTINRTLLIENVAINRTCYYK